jgi:DNA-binding CsgD family transcriptional regulator
VQVGKLRPPARAGREVLSPREQQVLRLTVEGKSNKEVATLLQLEVHTVRSYRKTMMAKLGASNVELIQVAAASGLIERINHSGTNTV